VVDICLNENVTSKTLLFMTNKYLSDRINALAESQTLVMNQKSRELASQGVDVINLTLGEPDFNTPDHIKEAAIEAIHNNITNYPPVPGFPQLRQAVVHKLQRDNNLEYSENQIVISNGAKHSLANVLQCVVNKGDEVIIPTPYWVSYAELVKLAEGTSVFIETGVEQDFKISANQLEAAITPKTKVVLLNSPSNPSGSVYTYEEFASLVEVLKRYPDIIIISDEIYETIIYEGSHVSVAQFSAIKDRVVLVNGVSKGYAMTGWRLGYIAAPDWIAKATTKLQGQYTSGACSIAQMAAVAAIQGDQSCVAEMREVFRRRRDLACDKIDSIDGFCVNKPAGAFYLFPDVSAFFGKANGDINIKNADDLCLYLLEKAHVATVSGSAFGTPACIRLSYATSDELLIAAFDRIAKALSQLR